MDTLTSFRLSQGFCKRLETLTISEMLPYQERALYDEIEGAEKSHAVENFRLAAQQNETGHCDGTFYGMVFQDSDVAKWLEAAAYALMHRPDERLLGRVRDLVTLIGRAQQPDGYLNTYFTVKEPGRRWSNLREAHELYCAGHMMEAAVALSECIGETELLRIMCRMADHMIGHFRGENADAFPGHPEVELALYRLYRCTGDSRYLGLSQQFVDARGATDFYRRELLKNPAVIWTKEVGDPAYSQAHQPVRKQRDAVGHAVRAVYLYAAMADLAAGTGDEALKNACKTLWQSITQRRMYITGGIGSTAIGEAFTVDYDLPNDTAYAETCAAIGLIFFARRMLNLEIAATYADEMERALYNCAAAGVALDGQSFFYVNPLEAVPGIAGEAATHRHVKPQRAQWFVCACCPPNAARLFTSLGRYAWSAADDMVYSHLFVAGTLDLMATHGLKITVDTAYPADGTVVYRVEKAVRSPGVGLALRMPAWSRRTEVLRNGSPAKPVIKAGYAYLLNLKDGDVISMTVDMEPRRVYASPKVAANSGRVAIMRGPLVYCAEGVDNQGDVLGLKVLRTAPILTLPADTLGGLPKLRVAGKREQDGEALYAVRRSESAACDITLIPYFAWANRGVTQMRCFLPEKG